MVFLRLFLGLAITLALFKVIISKEISILVITTSTGGYDFSRRENRLQTIINKIKKCLWHFLLFFRDNN